MPLEKRWMIITVDDGQTISLVERFKFLRSIITTDSMPNSSTEIHLRLPITRQVIRPYMSTQREVLEGQTRSHRAKRVNFGRGVRGSSSETFQKPTLQMVQSTLFLSYICEYY